MARHQPIAAAAHVFNAEISVVASWPFANPTFLLVTFALNASMT